MINPCRLWLMSMVWRVLWSVAHPVGVCYCPFTGDSCAHHWTGQRECVIYFLFFFILFEVLVNVKEGTSGPEEIWIPLSLWTGDGGRDLQQSWGREPTDWPQAVAAWWWEILGLMACRPAPQSMACQFLWLSNGRHPDSSPGGPKW